MERNQFSRFSEPLARLGSSGVGHPELRIGSSGPYELQYIPFEYVNREARLCLVGITPGITQLEIAYQVAQQQLLAGLPAEEVQRACKMAGAFGGKSMRPNLLKMLRHFKFDRILGIDDVADLWGPHSSLLHSTSVIPHAAFVSGKMFNGSFEEVLASKLLAECFEHCFIPSVRELNRDAMFVALGPTPRDALSWCVNQGVLGSGQVLGSFCHPSSAAGSATRYYLREVPRDQLAARDPVRHRCEWLDQAYAEMLANTSRLLGSPAFQRSAGTATDPPRVASETSPPMEPKKAASRPDPGTDSGGRAPDVEQDEVVAALLACFIAAGYRIENSTKKVAQVAAPNGEVVYLVKTTSRLNHIVIGVHPRLNREDLARLPGVADVSYAHRFHSNMTVFPKRIHKGNTETAYSWHVHTDSIGALESFLDAFARARFS